MAIRTDLAVEAKRLWDRSPEEKTKLSGVIARQSGYFGIPIDIVQIVDEEGVRALGKPQGTYVTVSMDVFQRRDRNSFADTVGALTCVLRDMLCGAENVLVVGLGNEDITADSVGPETLKHLIVTRHLGNPEQPYSFGLANTSAIAPGVLGRTGIESVEHVKGVLREVRPDAIIVIDALASCEPERLCMSVQVTDTGVIPGSGVGNHRAAFTKDSLGCPVIAIGVPTIVQAQTFLLLHGHEETVLREDLMISPRDIDQGVRELGKLIGFAINLSIHKQLTLDDIPSLL